MRDHSIRRGLPALLLTLALAIGVGGTALAAGDHFNEKFEFEDVTFPDGTSGEIYASSKRNNSGDQFTYCGYVGPNHEFMGVYGSGAFSSADGDEVLAFCLEHYDERS